MFAAQEGYLDAVKLLIEHNAELSLKSKCGRTAFHLATITNDQTPMVQLLFNNGKKTMPQYDWKTLMVASQTDHLGVAKSLIEHSVALVWGTKVVVVLHVAAFNDQTSVVRAAVGEWRQS